MSSRIPYNAASAEGQQVAEFVDAVQTALARGRRLKAALDSMQAGAPATPAAIEAEIGGMPAGGGYDLWYVVSVAVTAIDCAQVAELARLDQG